MNRNDFEFNVRHLTQFADQSGDSDEFVIPEDLAVLSDSDLSEMLNTAREHFSTMYGDGKNLTDEDVEVLAELSTGIERLQEAFGEREAASKARADRAAELASKVLPQDEEGDEEEDADEEDEDADADDAKDEDKSGDAGEEEEEEDGKPADSITASGPRKATRVKMSHVARRLPKGDDAAPATGIKDVLRIAGDGTGFAVGQGVDWLGAGKALDRRLSGFNHSQYAAAARAGKSLRSQNNLLTISKQYSEDLTINSSDGEKVEETLKFAANESRLAGNSLVASGGWCAPSETLYDLLEIETRDGILSLPEVNIRRGGINRTLGPDFASIFADITGFAYTEQHDIDGTYGVDANGIGDGSAGDKPCYHIECPEFEEYRLGIEGLCLTAGLLQQRGYPEAVARTIRGALVAHDHRVAGRVISDMVAGSQAVTMPSGQVGAIAPILDTIEKQVEWLRYKTRMSRTATVEGIFPFWVRSVVRSDLARRNGVDLISVSDAQINGWFSSRGVAPQYVYNWQDIDTSAPLTAWPTEISFLLYPAGGWVRGNADIITLDTLYDSTLLGQNDYTALFTEEGVVTIPMGHESLAVTTDFCADGSTAAAVDIDCDGTLAPAPETEPAP